MSKFNVGQLVKIIASTRIPDEITRAMIGTTAKVVEVCEWNGTYKLEHSKPSYAYFYEEDLIKGDPMDNLKQGDVLVCDDYSERVVQGLIGDIVFYTYNDCSDAHSTIAVLKENGWKLKDSTETTELTIEDIAKKFDLKPEQVRIRKEAS